MNEKTRREFLKSCFRLGGYAGIAGLGLGAVRDAQAFGILPAILSSGGTGAEAPEITAGANTYVCQWQSPAGNETGSGLGLAGANLVLTEHGNPAAAVLDSSGYYYRAFDGTGDYFSGATAIANAALSNADGKWTIGVKCKKITDNGTDAYYRLRNAGNTDQLLMVLGASKLNAQMKIGNVWVNPANPANNMTFGSETPIWLLAWADGGVNGARFGWTTTDPVLSGTTYWNWSNFAAGDRTESANAGNFNAINFDGEFRIGSAVGGDDIAADFYMFFCSKICLVNNGV